jgi:hypothetical protein
MFFGFLRLHYIPGESLTNIPLVWPFEVFLDDGGFAACSVCSKVDFHSFIHGAVLILGIFNNYLFLSSLNLTLKFSRSAFLPVRIICSFHISAVVLFFATCLFVFIRRDFHCVVFYLWTFCGMQNCLEMETLQQNVLF